MCSSIISVENRCLNFAFKNKHTSKCVSEEIKMNFVLKTINNSVCYAQKYECIKFVVITHVLNWEFTWSWKVKSDNMKCSFTLLCVIQIPKIFKAYNRKAINLWIIIKTTPVNGHRIDAAHFVWPFIKFGNFP